jgi:hypothetical protein
LLSGGIVAGLLLAAYFGAGLFRFVKIARPQQSDVFRLALVFFCLSAALFEPFIATNYFLWPILVMAITPSKRVS